MNNIKNLGSTGIYAYTTLISVFICAPGIFVFERDVIPAAKAVRVGSGLVRLLGKPAQNARSAAAVTACTALRTGRGCCSSMKGLVSGTGALAKL
jgi:hypothetical protein